MEKDIINSAFKIRITMLIIGKLLKDNLINIPVHLAFGHELIAAKTVRGNNGRAEFFLPHRNAHYNIALELEEDSIPRKYIYEIIGSANSKYVGRVGSMNYTDPGRGGYTSSILANHLGPAVGAAMYFKFKGLNKKSVAVIGDGAVEEGRFWEAMQFAYGKKLPLDIIIEDNDWSMQSQTWQRRSNILFDQLSGILSNGRDFKVNNSSETICEGPRIIHEQCNTLGGIHVKEEFNERYINYHSGKIYGELPLSNELWCFREGDILLEVSKGKNIYEDLLKYEMEVNGFVEFILQHDV
jgi:hypothetical protein